MHVFIVPIRDRSTHTPMPGVTLGDCGEKNGVHSLDNGFIILKDVRIPYDNLLDKYSSIDEKGNF